MSIVTVIVTTSENINAERRLDKGWTILDLKVLSRCLLSMGKKYLTLPFFIFQYKLEPITGIPADTQKLELYAGDTLVGLLDDESRMLGSYPVENFMRLNVREKENGGIYFLM